MHPGPRCPRHPSRPWALVSGIPCLSRSAAFGLGAPSSETSVWPGPPVLGALMGAPMPIPAPGSQPHAELASRFPPGGGLLLLRKAGPNRRSPKRGSPESGRLRL